VEDSHLTFKLVADFLYKNGYETENAATGEETLQKIEADLRRT
jgi:DNA-binding response OmpR family regulator